MKKIKINEIYYTFSGEGKTKGLPVVIVRTTGCNLKCSYCDSRYAYEEGTELTFDEIVQKINYEKYKCGRILLTGAEPLMSPYCLDLVKYLDIVLFFDVILETNGSLSIEEVLPFVDIVCMDVKCPSSDMSDKMYWKNLENIREQDEVKFVIGDRKDYNFAKDVMKKYCCYVSENQCVFSPVWGKIEPKTLAEWILEDKLDVRFSLQMHKIIWGDKRGT